MKMKTSDWMLLAGIAGLGGYALVRYLKTKDKKEDELPADVRFVQSIVTGDWEGAGEALADAWAPWGSLLDRYIVQPGSQAANQIADLPAYAYNWVTEHFVQAWEDNDPDTLYATNLQTTVSGGRVDSPTRLANMR